MALAPAIYATSTPEAFLFLLTITPASGGTGEPLRAVNNNEAVVSRGQRFEAYPFTLSLPADTGDKRPSAKLVIDNVDRRIVEFIRDLIEPPTFKVELILSGSPDIVEKAIDFLRLSDVTYDALTVEGTLEPNDVFGQPACDERYLPSNFPDLHYR